MRMKFELTHQDLAGGKHCPVLMSMYINRRYIEIVQLFLTGNVWIEHL